MKYFISIIMTVVLFSNINAQTQTRICSETLSFTYFVGVPTYTYEDNEYVYSRILQVPVVHNTWLLNHGYDIEEVLYVKGIGKSRDMNYALAQAEIDARGNAVCLGYEETRDTYTVEKDSWEKKNFLKKLFGK